MWFKLQLRLLSNYEPVPPELAHSVDGGEHGNGEWRTILGDEGIVKLPFKTCRSILGNYHRTGSELAHGARYSTRYERLPMFVPFPLVLPYPLGTAARCAGSPVLGPPLRAQSILLCPQ